MAQIPLPIEQRVCMSIAALIVASIFVPAFQESGRDSFPWSSYPMFSFGRPDTGLVLGQALGIHADGEVSPLDSHLVGGSFEVLQTMMTIQRAIHDGPAHTSALCEEILSRVGDDTIVTVEIATSSFDTLDYFRNGHRPIRRDVHTRCTRDK